MIARGSRRVADFLQEPRFGGAFFVLHEATAAVGQSLVAEARELGVDISQAAEVGIAAAVAGRRQDGWLAANKHALDSSSEFIERHGLPSARCRKF